MDKMDVYKVLEEDNDGNTRLELHQEKMEYQDAMKLQRTSEYIAISDSEKSTVWMRVGMDLHFTPEEIKQIICTGINSGTTYDIIIKVLKEDRYTLNGESYVPNVFDQSEFIVDQETQKGISLADYCM